MALQPTGGQVAVCIHKLSVVLLRDTATGEELHRLEGLNDVNAVRYSPNGTLLIVSSLPGGTACTKVFAAATGEELHSFDGKGGFHGDIDPSGTLLAMTGPPGTNTMVNLESGEEVLALDKSHYMIDVAFNDSGDRMVYAPSDTHGGCEVVICERTSDGAWCETQRRDISDRFIWVLHAQFSPGDGRYLLLVSIDEGDNVGHGRIVVLDTETGEEPARRRAFRALLLPTGDLH
eukprot:SAG31_NODE_8020_length_1514_cov_1.357639_1_plen_232_part_10